MQFFTEHMATGYLVLEWSLRLLALFVVPRRRQPTSGTAWLLIIFLFPVPGWLAFLVLGFYKLPQNRQEIQQLINTEIDDQIESIKHSSKDGASIVDPVLPSKYQSLEDLTQEYGRFPSLAANDIDIFTDYNEPLERIVQDIENAKDSVHIAYYILALDDTTEPLFAALEQAHARGIDVKVLYDSWGSHTFPRKSKAKQRMREAGIPFKSMLPLTRPGKSYIRPDLRNHRKIVIIDDAIGYIGSQNIINKTYNRRDNIEYDELVVRVTGPIVFEIGAIFITDWISEGGQIDEDQAELEPIPYKLPGAIMQMLPSGPGFIDENNLRVFTHLFHLADKSITIVNPYFVPPESMLGAITSAARRGVKVRMINSQAIDQWMVGYAQRSYYTMLLEAGVELLLYKKPNLLHSKFIVVDDEIAVVGSSNMDMRSFELDSELSLICYNDKIARDMQKIADDYAKKSTILKLETWQQRRLYKRFIENISRLTSSVQ